MGLQGEWAKWSWGKSLKKTHGGRKSLLGDKNGAAQGYINTWLHRWKQSVSRGPIRSMVPVCVTGGGVCIEVCEGSDEDECENVHA